jgi:hypothetical protein
MFFRWKICGPLTLRPFAITSIMFSIRGLRIADYAMVALRCGLG